MKVFLKILLVLYVYLMIHKPELIFIPRSINSFFGIIGVCVYAMTNHSTNKSLWGVNISLIPILKISIPFLIMGIVSPLVNGTHDFHFIEYFISVLLSFFSVYLLALLFYATYKSVSSKRVIEYILIAHTVYMTVSMMMFMSSDIYSFLQPLLRLNEGASNAYYLTAEKRITCFGASFFTAGIINGYVMILSAFYLTKYKLSLNTTYTVYAFMVVTSIVGMMMARTSIVGIIISLFILLKYWLSTPSRFLRNVAVASFLALSSFYLYNGLLSSSDARITALSDFAFEIIENYQTTGRFATHSSDNTMSMYSILPDNEKTWTIGDGRWSNTDGTYYKFTDVGFSRYIWYFGLLGMACLVVFFWKTIKLIFVKRSIIPGGGLYVAAILFVYVLALNLKGPVDLFFYILPFYFCNSNICDNA